MPNEIEIKKKLLEENSIFKLLIDWIKEEKNINVGGDNAEYKK
ncbi:MAG: hypothetical protein QXT38_04310 [Candidatus Aenigmatarchaeota archaeon]